MLEIINNTKLKIYLATLLVSSLIWAQPFSGGPRVSTVILMLLGLTVLVRQLFSTRDQRFTRFSIIILLFWIPAVFSLIGSVDRDASLKFIILLPLFIPFAAGILYLLDNYVDRKLLINILTIVCVFWIVDGLIQFILGQDIFGIVSKYGERIVGPFAYHLRLSLFLSITLPVILSRLEKVAWGWTVGYLATVTFVIMLSGVRTDLLTVLIAITIYFLFKKRIKLLLAFIPLLLLAGLLASHYSGISQHKLSSFGAIPHSYSEWNQASSHRLDIWGTAWNMYKNNPVTGVGVKAFTHAYDKYKGADDIFNEKTAPVSHAHHPLISIAAETGTIGLIGLLVGIWLLLFRWRVKSSKGSALENRWLQMLVLIFFPIQSMPILFSLWWFPVVSMAILFYLSDVEVAQKRAIK